MQFPVAASPFCSLETIGAYFSFLFLDLQAVLRWPFKLVVGPQPFSAWTGEVFPNCSTRASFVGGTGPMAPDVNIFGEQVLPRGHLGTPASAPQCGGDSEGSFPTAVDLCTWLGPPPPSSLAHTPLRWGAFSAAAAAAAAASAAAAAAAAGGGGGRYGGGRTLQRRRR